VASSDFLPLGLRSNQSEEHNAAVFEPISVCGRSGQLDNLAKGKEWAETRGLLSGTRRVHCDVRNMATDNARLSFPSQKSLGACFVAPLSV
jgi:hypothetical protein